MKRMNLVLTNSEEEEHEAQGRKSQDQDDPQDSLVQGLVTPPTTKVNTSGEEQVEEISPNTLKQPKTLSKVASLKPRAIDKGRNTRKKKRLKGRKVISSLDLQEEVDDVADSQYCCEQASTVGEDKGQREGKAPMLSEETPKKSKEQIRKLKLMQVVQKSMPGSELQDYKDSLKRFGEELQTKTPKRLKEDKDDEAKDDEPTKKSGKRRKQILKGKNAYNPDKNDSEDSDKVGEQEETVTGTETPINPVPVAMKTPSVATYKIIKQGEKGVYQIVIVMNRYGMDGPEDKLEKGFWTCLRIMFEEPLSTDSIWSEIGIKKIIVGDTIILVLCTKHKTNGLSVQPCRNQHKDSIQEANGVLGAKGLTSPEQTATGKGISNPFDSSGLSGVWFWGAVIGFAKNHMDHMGAKYCCLMGLRKKRCGASLNELSKVDENSWVVIADPKGNGCFECGAPGHFKRDCPKLKNKDGGNGDAQGWVYAVGNAEKRGNASGNPESNVVTSTFLLNNHYTSILFDTGADKFFISTAFSSLIDIVPTLLDNSYDVELADGKIVRIGTIIRGCTLNFLKTIPLNSTNARRISSNGRESRLTVISYSKAQEYMAKGCQVFLAQISAKKDEDKSKGKQLKDVPIVRDFPEVFPEDLLGLPLARPVEF
ncbi:putative reverse transcriptase domain-containing protein [Tanacetum coccineum]